MRRLILALVFLALSAGAARAACPATLADCPSINANTGKFGGELTAPVTATGGTTQQTLADRFANVLSIRDLGAKCDGTTDDSAAFTAAAAKPNGTTIYIPQNATCIVLPQQFEILNKIINIIGADRQTSIIKYKPGATITTNLFWFHQTGALGQGPTIRDLTFDMSNLDVGGTSVTSVVSFSNANLATVTRIRVINMGNVVTAAGGTYAISCAGCTNWTVTDSYFQQTTPDQTHQSKAILTFASGGPNVGGSIRNNVLINTNFNFSCAQQYVIDGNDVSGWGVGAGIAMGWGTYSGSECPSFDNVVSKNRVHDSQVGNDMYGISPNGLEIWSDRTVISNNVAWYNSASGVTWGGAYDVVSGNLAYDNGRLAGGAGFAPAYSTPSHVASYSVVVGNLAYDTGAGTQTYGYTDMSQVVGLQLLDNYFTGTGAQGVNIQANTSTQIEHGAPINIRNLGAACDGVTDDTAAFTYAISLPSQTVIQIPAKATCMITAQNYNVTGGRTIDFVGAGVATSIIKLAAGQTMTNSLFNETGTRPVFRDLTIDMNNATVGTPGFAAISFNVAVQPTVRNVAIINGAVGILGVACNGCIDFTVQGSRVQTAVSNTVLSKGISVTGGTAANVGGLLADNVITGARIELAAVQNYRVANNDVSGFASNSGIVVTHFNSTTRPSFSNQIEGNRVHDADASSGQFAGMVIHTNNSLIAHNLLWNNATAGLLSYSQNTMHLGNVAWDNNKNALANVGGFQAGYVSATDSADGSVWQGNIAYDSGVGRQYYGFTDAASLTNVRLFQNQFSGATGAVRIVAGTIDGMQLDKLGAAPTVAPGAGKVTLFTVAGTTAGTCKLQALAGTSITPVLVLDNIGGGC